jgi:DNA repair protein RadC
LHLRLSLDQQIAIIHCFHDTEEAFADMSADRAVAVIFVHNHPSGDLQPSDADLKMHEQLMEAEIIKGL